MGKTYVAMAMKKNIVREDAYVFNSLYPIIGTIDEETHIFTDREGNQFIPILNALQMDTDDVSVYGQTIELSSLKNVFQEENLTKEEALKEYEKQAKKQLVFCGVDEKGEVVPGILDIDNLKELMSGGKIVTVQDAKKEEDKTIRHPYQGTYSLKWLTSTKEGMHPGIQLLLKEISEEKLSQEELEKIKAELKMSLDDFHQAIETIRLQIEGLEIQNGKPSSLKIELPIHYREGMLESIKQVLTNTMNGTYSLQEQKRIKERLMDIEEDLSQVLYSIEKQFKETHRYESSNRLSGKISLPPFDIDDVYHKIKETIVCQDVPLRHLLIELSKKEMDARTKKRGILLIGQTGVGKTEIMELIAKYLDRPFLAIDTTQLTSEGYVGGDIERELWRLYMSCGKNIDRAEQAILYFDEIDKKGSENNSDVSGKAVLNEILPLIGGSTYTAAPSNKVGSPSVELNTHNMIICLGGSFEQVFEQLNVSPAGFERQESKKRVILEKKDLKKLGLMPKELLGRVSLIQLNFLQAPELKRVLYESKDSELKVQESIFKQLGVRIHFTSEFVDIVSERAEKLAEGVRGTQTIVDELTNDAYDYVLTSHWGEVEEITFTKETTEDTTQYQKVYRSEPIKRESYS